jgi:hypothetical protein
LLIAVKKLVCLVTLLLAAAAAKTAELKISTTEPVVVSAPADWQLTKLKPPTPVPFETYKISPPDARNAACLITLLDTKRQEFADPDFLKMLLKADSRPYVNSATELKNIKIKELKISGGMAFHANFIDPDLVGKPIKKGDYKTATSIMISLGTKYLIKVTVLCDDLDGTDYREALKIVQSLKEKDPEA